MYDVKSESQPDTIASLGINYCLQIIETCFAEWFYASHTWACTDSFENFREISLKGDLSNDITLNPPLFSLVNTFNAVWCWRFATLTIWPAICYMMLCYATFTLCYATCVAVSVRYVTYIYITIARARRGHKIYKNTISVGRCWDCTILHVHPLPNPGPCRLCVI